jgi:ribosomal 30S subunit maturation factor RimM
MKRMLAIAAATVLSISSVTAVTAVAQIAGKTTLGVTVVEMDALVAGRSAKRDLIGKTVVNDQKQKIGKIDDIIVGPNNEVSFAIVGVGGFVGLGKHDVAIPMNQLQINPNNIVLPGASKEALKALPKFEYRARG